MSYSDFGKVRLSHTKPAVGLYRSAGRVTASLRGVSGEILHKTEGMGTKRT